MTEVEVSCEPRPDGWLCHVTLTEGASETRHDVRVAAAELDRLAPGADDPADLVRASFAFLLEREPKESILRAFDLPVIGRYFPEYESTIRGRIIRRDV